MTTPTEPQTHHAAIALGSNLGDRADSIHQALQALDEHPDIAVQAVSDLIETEPLLPQDAGTDAPPPYRYLNGAALLNTALPPHQLIEAMLNIEAGLGRTRRARWESRIIDLDLLLYDQRIINDPPHLLLPHPEMHKRLFVLEPLAQIAPDLLHPIQQRTIAQLLRICAAAEQSRTI
ncbi:MAG: 2-amino-4-hydroxy-6-hydroxymethyldihydropteridine diphosphokinase [Planctomycetes bacterium]|nr:2-amino-4-hydroxy-6-hydroxymethyldihydropteridine diphosphokinase [Planctomycetota bacterium]NOG53569.1 2-amino-4-hydroxy-6-hydroxymethyldihydropteridine diphosphokinase [Planctomycetota bacterium]